MSRRSSRRGTTPAFPALSEGVQNGLRRLMTDNASTVAEMLDCTDQDADVLCEKCAQVMKQQQLSAASFLARFFSSDMLAEHAELCGKSSKGSAATLSDRIAAAWAQNKAPLPEAKAEGKQKETQTVVEEEATESSTKDGDKEADEDRKRKEKGSTDEGEEETTEKVPKKKAKSSPKGESE